MPRGVLWAIEFQSNSVIMNNSPCCDVQVHFIIQANCWMSCGILFGVYSSISLPTFSLIKFVGSWHAPFSLMPRFTVVNYVLANMPKGKATSRKRPASPRPAPKKSSRHSVAPHNPSVEQEPAELTPTIDYEKLARHIVQEQARAQNANVPPEQTSPNSRHQMDGTC